MLQRVPFATEVLSTPERRVTLHGEILRATWGDSDNVVLEYRRPVAVFDERPETVRRHRIVDHLVVARLMALVLAVLVTVAIRATRPFERRSHDR